MRTFSPSKKAGSSLPSIYLSPPSKHSIVVVCKPGSTQGSRARPPSRETSARKNAPWLYNSASLIAEEPAHLAGRSASAISQSFGTHSVQGGQIGEQFSYFCAAIAPRKKIISSGPEALTRSTDYVDNNKLAEGAPFLARQLGGHRRRPVHRPRRRGHLPAR